MAGHRVSGKADYMMDDRHTTSQSGQILTRQHFLLLVYNFQICFIVTVTMYLTKLKTNKNFDNSTSASGSE